MRKTARNEVTEFESHFCGNGCQRGYKFQDAVKQIKSLKDVGAQFLLCAILENHVKCVEKLIKAGADVNGVGMFEDVARTPLSLSLLIRNVEYVALLLKAGASIGYEGSSPTGSEFFEILCAAGVNMNTANTHSELQNSNPLLSLKDLCRETIRKHLVVNNAGQNLFASVPQLGLPSTLEKYLLYEVSLEDIMNGR